MRAPRLAILAAFPFPLDQGSQVFVRDQMRALARAGAEVTLLCYGSGSGEAPADLEILRTPRALSTRALRAGPTPGKPLAGGALLALYLRACREQGFDATLAHNAEAALIAALARPFTRTPAVYVAHTLLALELPTYARPSLGRTLARLGGALDRGLAARSDAVLCLSGETARRLAPSARGPVEVIPPGLDPAPPPPEAARRRACERLGVEAGRFALYAGNLDAYQDLPDLARAARRIPRHPVVVATHAPLPRGGLGPLRAARVADFDELRALTFAAGVAVLPRRRPGGFPIKLLNYLEASLPVVARADVAEGCEHDRSAWLLPDEATDAGLATAIDALLRDPARAARLGRGARTLLETRHAWPPLAARTLALARKAGDGS